LSDHEETTGLSRLCRAYVAVVNGKLGFFGIQAALLLLVKNSGCLFRMTASHLPQRRTLVPATVIT